MYQYWSSDGTPAGNAYFRDASELFIFEALLYFVGNVGGSFQFYKSDGTFQGTVPVDFPVGGNFDK